MTKSMNGETMAYTVLNDIYLTYVLSKTIQPADYFIVQFIINRTILFKKLREYITIDQFLEGVFTTHEEGEITMYRMITPPVPFKKTHLYDRLAFLKALGIITIDTINNKKIYGINVENVTQNASTHKNFSLKKSIQKEVKRKLFNENNATKK